ncbi:MAG: hypothetical protein IH858_03865 [Chloroflexi bacterium]|nr:hypothetical protein [Chloroflexota bacterium]
MGEFWTGATSDFENARRQLRQLAILGFFGPPVSELYADVKELRFSDERVENVWKQLEEQVERSLHQHADEVEAVVEALLEKDELSNTEVLEILGKNSLQVAVDEGLEMESVLEQLGVNPSGLAYQRRERLRVEEKIEEPAPKAAVSSEKEKKSVKRKRKS